MARRSSGASPKDAQPTASSKGTSNKRRSSKSAKQKGRRAQSAYPRSESTQIVKSEIESESETHTQAHSHTHTFKNTKPTTVKKNAKKKSDSHTHTHTHTHKDAHIFAVREDAADKIISFFDSHPSARILPDCEAAIVKRAEIDKTFNKKASQMMKGVSVVPVIKNSHFTVVCIQLAPSAQHGPFINPAGYIHCKVMKGEAESIAFVVGANTCVNKDQTLMMSQGAHFQIPPHQTYALKNCSKTTPCEVSATICKELPDFDPEEEIQRQMQRE